MSDIVLGKRHAYKPSDKKSLSDRAKTLGFSAEEIGELDRLYGSSDPKDMGSKAPQK